MDECGACHQELPAEGVTYLELAKRHIASGAHDGDAEAVAMHRASIAWRKRQKPQPCEDCGNLVPFIDGCPTATGLVCVSCACRA